MRWSQIPGQLAMNGWPCIASDNFPEHPVADQHWLLFSRIHRVDDVVDSALVDQVGASTGDRSKAGDQIDIPIKLAVVPRENRSRPGLFGMNKVLVSEIIVKGVEYLDYRDRAGAFG